MCKRRNSNLTEDYVRGVLEEMLFMRDEFELDEAFCTVMDYGEEDNIAELAVEYFAHDLYEYMKEHMVNPTPVIGMDLDENPLVLVKRYELLDSPGVCIGKERDEFLYDKFQLENWQELWLLEDGLLAQVRVVEYRGKHGEAQYRFVERYHGPKDEPAMMLESIAVYLDELLHEEKYEEF